MRLAGIFCIICLITTGSCGQQSDNEQESVKIISLSELTAMYVQDNDTSYVVNFWATWCKPCIEEFPYFEKLSQNYIDKKVKVIMVSLDIPNQIESTLIPFIQDRKISLKIVLLDEPDENSWIPKVNPKWTGSIPATLIENKAQNIHFFREGTITYKELENEILSVKY